MALIKNIALMSTSTAVRLGFGLFTFVVMARFLGPDKFGLVMLWLSVATLTGLLANYGFTPYLLREMAAKPDTARRTMSEVLTAKLLLSGAVLCGGAISLYWLEADSRWVFFFLLAALLADSMTEFFNVGFRATNRFAAETRLASFASLLQFIVVVGAIYYWPTAVAAAVAFMFSRVLVMVMTWLAQLHYFKDLKIAAVTLGFKRIRDAKAFAIDFGLQSVFGQLDSIVLHTFGGTAAVGVYQAGMRLFLAGAQAAAVLGNVFIPQVAATEPHSASRIKGFWQIFIGFCAIGIGGAIGFLLFNKTLVLLVFGPKFEGLGELLPAFGLLFFIRFAAAGMGCLLTIEKLQGARAYCTFVHWLVVAILVWLLGVTSPVSWLLYLAFGNAVLFVLYAGVFYFSRRK